MGQVVKNLVFGPVQTGQLSISLFQLLGKPGVFNGKGNGSRNHAQKLSICLLKGSLLFIDGGQNPDNPITAPQRD